LPRLSSRSGRTLLPPPWDRANLETTELCCVYLMAITTLPAAAALSVDCSSLLLGWSSQKDGKVAGAAEKSSSFSQRFGRKESGLKQKSEQGT
jgi:hypothetical protein